MASHYVVGVASHYVVGVASHCVVKVGKDLNIMRVDKDSGMVHE